MEYPLPHQKYSWSEYQSLETSGKERYEYHDGRIVSLAGASNRHNKIVGRVLSTLLRATDKQGCHVFAESVRLFRFQSDRYFYPDVMVTCNPPDLQSKNGVRSPSIIVEVISRSTVQHDLGFKFREYFAIPSVQHYLVMYQDECMIHHFERSGEQDWKTRIYTQMDQTIDLPTIAARIALADLYRGIEFGPEITYAEEEAARYQAEETP